MDTRSVCGDANNGFGLLVNMNSFGPGAHSVRALADGQEIGRIEGYPGATNFWRFLDRLLAAKAPQPAG